MAVLHRLSPIRFPFTSDRHREVVTPDAILDAIDGPWSLGAMALLVFGDAFFVIIPGEIAVTALGALSTAMGTPPLWAVILCAAVAATCGDITCYCIGRRIGLDRWRWMRSAPVRRAQRWAHARLQKSTAAILFTARFIPFARLAVNLVAGATRISFARYVGLTAFAATGWASYQAAIGALFAALLPGAPLLAISLSVLFALLVGAIIDYVMRRRAERRRGVAEVTATE
jgi:membrane-associated protein